MVLSTCLNAKAHVQTQAITGGGKKKNTNKYRAVVQRVIKK